MKKYIKEYQVSFTREGRHRIEYIGQANQMLAIFKQELAREIGYGMYKEVLQKIQEFMRTISREHSNFCFLSGASAYYHRVKTIKNKEYNKARLEVICRIKKLNPPDKSRTNARGENIQDKREGILLNKQKQAREFDEYLEKFRELLEVAIYKSPQFLEFFENALQKENADCYSTRSLFKNPVYSIPSKFTINFDKFYIEFKIKIKIAETAIVLDPCFPYRLFNDENVSLSLDKNTSLTQKEKIKFLPLLKCAVDYLEQAH